MGSKDFQQRLINWSNRSLGNVARTQTKIKQTKITFKSNMIILEKVPDTKTEGIKDQLPKKNKTYKDDIKSILEYSPKKNMAKINEEYSTL